MAARAEWPGMGDEIPVTRYAQIGELSIAYQVVGNGPVDLVHIPSWITSRDCSPA